MTRPRPILTLALFALAIAATSAGCLERRVSGHFGGEAYYNAYDHYRVRYDADTPGVLGAPWELTNFELDGAGRPGMHRRGDEHLLTYDLQRYTRLRRGGRTFSLARYDLRYVRPGGDAEIFARTIPLRSPWSADPLPTLMRRSVASIGSLEADGPDLLGRGVTAPAVVELVREGPARVDGRRAYFVTFDLRRGNGASAQTERITLIGVRPETPLAVGGRARLPILMLFALVSSPARHDVERETFASVVRRVDFAEGFR